MKTSFIDVLGKNKIITPTEKMKKGKPEDQPTIIVVIAVKRVCTYLGYLRSAY